MRVGEDDARWFVEKANMDPGWLERVFVQGLNKLSSRMEGERDQANRDDGLDSIKYRQGKLDGVNETLKLIGGMRMSEVKKPGPEQPLVARILGSWRS